MAVTNYDVSNRFKATGAASEVFNQPSLYAGTDDGMIFPLGEKIAGGYKGHYDLNWLFQGLSSGLEDKTTYYNFTGFDIYLVDALGVQFKIPSISSNNKFRNKFVIRQQTSAGMQFQDGTCYNSSSNCIDDDELRSAYLLKSTDLNHAKQMGGSRETDFLVVVDGIDIHANDIYIKSFNILLSRSYVKTPFSKHPGLSTFNSTDNISAKLEISYYAKNYNADVLYGYYGGNILQIKPIIGNVISDYVTIKSMNILNDDNSYSVNIDKIRTAKVFDVNGINLSFDIDTLLKMKANDSYVKARGDEGKNKTELLRQRVDMLTNIISRVVIPGITIAITVMKFYDSRK